MGSMAVGFTAAYTSPALASLDAAANATLDALNITLDGTNATDNATLEALSSTLTVNEEQKSWIGSLMPLSALIGSILGGYLVDALGRKMVILLCGPPFIVGEQSFDVLWLSDAK
ncbi:Facilitated trehalose transporter Tret1 [Portunus trituberculatus]|uniref:Facilitated trehalose transporter Tret1 n=1 Tax=Portunus trituberculatus TaxID=210409 RepID=A0A5B7K4A4_PORTR|nr:Facilitated trehalose transporter Tret1 [Portunus trituberculatus]